MDILQGSSSGDVIILTSDNCSDNRTADDCSLRSRFASPPPNPAGIGGALRSSSVLQMIAPFGRASPHHPLTLRV
jgi:hypothetical protein